MEFLRGRYEMYGIEKLGRLPLNIYGQRKKVLIGRCRFAKELC